MGTMDSGVSGLSLHLGSGNRASLIDASIWKFQKNSTCEPCKYLLYI